MMMIMMMMMIIIIIITNLAIGRGDLSLTSCHGDHGSISHVEFVVEKVTLGQASLPVLRIIFACHSISA